MKRLVKILVFLILLVIAGYLYINCVIKVEEGVFVLVQDRETGDIKKILNSGYSFLLDGIIPEKVSIIKISKKNTQFMDLKIPIPLLENLKSDLYAVKIPITVNYEIMPDKLAFDINRLKGGEGYIATLLEKLLRGYFNKEFASYFSPSYRRGALVKDIETLIGRVESALRTHCLKLGITIGEFVIVGNIDLPDLRTFYDGMRYFRELVDVEKNNKKELIILQSKLEKDRISNSQLYEKLEEISKIIKKNPDILKYIYIEKMGDKVKVIISPDNSGMPFGFNFNSSDSKPDRRGEIDNLR
jgi:hypothetical protein